MHCFGSAVTKFCVGDQVAICTASTYYTFIRAKYAVYLPDSISLVDVALILTAFCTTYVRLVQVAHLQKGETILIYAAAGGTG